MMHCKEFSHCEKNTRIPGQDFEGREDKIEKDGR